MLSFIALSACKKEKIIENIHDDQSQSQSLLQTDYKYSSIVKIQGEKPEDGYLNLTVSSNDEDYLKIYIAKLEKVKIIHKEANLLSDTKAEKPNSLIDNESDAGVSLYFDWSNFHSHFEKGKLYGIYLTPKDQGNTKSLVLLYSMNNVTSFSTTGSYAAVNVYSTQPPFQAGCLCNTQSKWSFTNADGFHLYEKTMSRYDNLEMRTFSCIFLDCYYENFALSPTTYYTEHRIYYRPRFNYSSPELPPYYADYNHIKSGAGKNSYTNVVSEKATVTFYIAG